MKHAHVPHAKELSVILQRRLCTARACLKAARARDLSQARTDMKLAQERMKRNVDRIALTMGDRLVLRTRNAVLKRLARSHGGWGS
jgi:hypothetical protein